jgi:hypothetical protein
MSTIGMYYGPESGSSSDSALYGDLFAQSVWFGRTTAALKSAFRTAAGGKDFETTVYEGNAVWGPYNAAADLTTYGKEVSLGAAVSLVDHFAAANQAGVTVNNLFHFNGNVWAIVTNYPNLYRKPSFWAAKLFTTEISGDLVTCTVEGSGTYTSALPGEPPTPIVACYAYRNGGRYQVLLVNRSRTAAQNVTVARSLLPAKLVVLTAANINANNESGETVSLTTQTLTTGATNAYVVSVPPYSAVMLVGDDVSGTAPTAVTASGSADGQEGVALTPVTFTAAAGTFPFTWSVSSGAVPAGLSLDAGTGVLSGTPTTAGSYDFTVTATNSYGSASTPVHVVIAPVSGGNAGGNSGAGTGGGSRLSPAVGGCAAAPSGWLGEMLVLGALAVARRRRCE